MLKKSLFERGKVFTDLPDKFRLRANNSSIVVHVKNKKTNQHITEFQKTIFEDGDARTSAFSQIKSVHDEEKKSDR